MVRSRSQRGHARRRRTQVGAAAVEMALVTPLFVMLVFGVIAFGTVFAQKLSLGNAARQAARFGVVANHSCADIISAARDATTGTIAMTSSAVTVTVKRGQTAAAATSACAGPTDTAKPCTGAADNDSLFVTTSYTSKLIIPLALVRSSFPISSQGVFRCEYS